MTTTCDFLVIGGGVIGLSIARELRRRHPDADVVLIEKEERLGLHASGRNSGVLHAGFYYSADSLKAKFTRQGNTMLREYCADRGIPVNTCGKLVVAKDEREHPVLDELLQRGKRNGVELEKITAEDAREIEPRVRTHRHALWSPATASVDPTTVMEAMREDASREGVSIRSGVRWLGSKGRRVDTTAGVFEPGYLVNAAGLYADQIARAYGFSERYRILPFKGLYLYSDESPGAIRTNIYPVPDLRNPFLGVHFTVTVDGHAKIGPTAIPAFWREQYSGFDNFKTGELFDILFRQMKLFFASDFDFKNLAVEELRKYVRSHLVSLATALMDDVRPEHYRRWGKPGIRAQLMDINTGKLEMDFVFEHDDQSMHVLNAVSPGFTCSLPFAHHICDHIPT